MYLIYRLVFAASLLLHITNTRLIAMERRSDEVSFAQSIMQGDPSTFKNIDSLPRLINKALIMVKLASGKLVKVAPLWYAVHTRNESMLTQLFTLGAPLFGKDDEVLQPNTPLQEACKHDYDSIINIFKKSWLMYWDENWQQEYELRKQRVNEKIDNLEQLSKGDDQWIGAHVAENLESLDVDFSLLNLDVSASNVHELAYGLKVAVLANNFEKIREICSSQMSQFTTVNINQVLVPYTLPEKIVRVSPLLYAVCMQNIPLIEVLCECGASPLGKYDAVHELGTPLWQAYKSSNGDLIAKMRELAVKFIKSNLQDQIEFQKELLILSEEKEECMQMQGDVSILEDICLLIEKSSDQEIDEYLMVEDKIATYDLVQQDMRLAHMSMIVKMINQRESLEDSSSEEPTVTEGSYNPHTSTNSSE